MLFKRFKVVHKVHAKFLASYFFNGLMPNSGLEWLDRV